MRTPCNAPRNTRGASAVHPPSRATRAHRTGGRHGHDHHGGRRELRGARRQEVLTLHLTLTLNPNPNPNPSPSPNPNPKGDDVLDAIGWEEDGVSYFKVVHRKPNRNPNRNPTCNRDPTNRICALTLTLIITCVNFLLLAIFSY